MGLSRMQTALLINFCFLTTDLKLTTFLSVQVDKKKLPFFLIEKVNYIIQVKGVAEPSFVCFTLVCVYILVILWVLFTLCVFKSMFLFSRYCFVTIFFFFTVTFLPPIILHCF